MSPDRKTLQDRRTLSSTASARSVKYLLTKGLTQSDIAALLKVSDGYISLVKSRERSLTIDHLEVLAAAVGVSLGAFMTAVSEPGSTASPGLRRIHEISSEVLKRADAAREAILRDLEAARKSD